MRERRRPVASTRMPVPPGVNVRIYQTRFDYADRVLELSVTHTVHVTAGPGSRERSGDWDLAVDDAVRARLYAWLADRCGY